MIKKDKLLTLINILFVFLFKQISYCTMVEQESPLPVNCIIATRNVEAFPLVSVSYGKMSKEEIRLVFAGLAFIISGNEEAVLKKTTKDLATSSLLNYVKKAFKEKKLVRFYDTPLLNKNKPTVVLFNEMFFGRTIPLSRSEVDDIVNCYKEFLEFLPNTYLYINFLYKDKFSQSYNSQIEVSRRRYAEIQKNEVSTGGWDPFPSIWIAQHPSDPKQHYTGTFNGVYLKLVNSEDIASDTFRENLLFNQTKIFYEGKEIGFYNKSSFQKESILDFNDGSKFKEKGIPFYMIGNFATIWLADHDPLLDDITNVVCYDVDAMLRLSGPIPLNNFCFFASNTHTDFVASVRDGAKDHRVFKKACVCSDAEGRIGGLNGFESIDAGYRGAISGIFTATPKTLFPLVATPPAGTLSFKFPKSNYSMYIFDCK